MIEVVGNDYVYWSYHYCFIFFFDYKGHGHFFDCSRYGSLLLFIDSDNGLWHFLCIHRIMSHRYRYNTAGCCDLKLTPGGAEGTFSKNRVDSKGSCRTQCQYFCLQIKAAGISEDSEQS